MDGHERPKTIAYMPVSFTKKYLGFEIQSHQWLQITLDESNALLVLEGNIAAQCGFHYISEVDGIDIFEYHIDASYKFEERLSLLCSFWRQPKRPKAYGF